ncbi:hypothetical protein [Aeromonas hydrophila]|uniref:hypothetical protein n=1 Tax=Aeromonas hydrophila TaxID=644 RepID=UPI003217A910
MTEVTIKIESTEATLLKWSQSSGVSLDTLRWEVKQGTREIMPKNNPKSRPRINVLAEVEKACRAANLNKVTIVLC